jgi:hypothetical protein
MNAEGRISFVLKPRKMVEPTPCRFRAVEGDGTTADTVKYPDGSVDVEINGPHGRPWSFKKLPSVSDPKGVEVVVTWDATAVTLHMGGAKIQQQAV